MKIALIQQKATKSEAILLVDCDFSIIPFAPAQRHFLLDRRPDFYRSTKLVD